MIRVVQSNTCRPGSSATAAMKLDREAAPCAALGATLVAGEETVATLSMYRASVPVFIQLLDGTLFCLNRAREDAVARKYNPDVLPTLRLSPDMMPLAGQIQVATNHATVSVARLAGMDPPDLGEPETTMAEVIGRVERALAFLRTIRPEQLDGSEEREIVLPKRARVAHLEQAGILLEPNQYPLTLYPMTFRGADYLLSFALPNFYFHVTMTYALLRQGGVNLGKMDYIGALPRID